MEELDKLLVGDLEPVIADLPTVPKDEIKDIDDQLPDVPTTVPTQQLFITASIIINVCFYFAGT